MNFIHRLKNLFLTGQHYQESKLDDLQQRIGYHFTDKSLLTLALTHRSYSNSGSKESSSNERMEFLGDSVLGMIISEQLFRDYPKKHEGELTKIKALLVNESTLAAMGQAIGLNNFIRLSNDEERAGGRQRPSIVSDAFESVLGAVYLDSGTEAVRSVIMRLLYNRKDQVLKDTSLTNYKGELLELVQGKGNGMPHYDVVTESGPDHDKTFVVCVAVSGREIGRGSGHTKKEAEQKAAAEALELLT